MLNISLVVATINRFNEIDVFLSSILHSDFDLTYVQIVIVDQNFDPCLDSIIRKYPTLNIVHVKSTVSGLSFNRNLGVSFAVGDVVCFPDDDCTFYPDTLSKVSLMFGADDNTDFCIGRIYDREAGSNIIKSWPSKSCGINKFNFYFLSSSITIFVRRQYLIDFDTNMGAGAKFGSCEDADFLLRLLMSGAKGVYTPHIEVWHPKPNYQKISFDKVNSYASGFGYFVRKDFSLLKAILLLLLLVKKLFQLFLNIFVQKFPKGYFSSFFKGLLSGLKI